MAKKKVVLTPLLMKRIGKYIDQGYLKNEIAVKIGIGRMTFYRWEQKNPELKALVDEASKARTEKYEEEIIEIADDTSRDTLIDPETGREYPNASAVSRATLRIKTRTDVMKYNNPEKFGDKSKLDVTSNGETLSGFQGLVITPPKLEEDEDVDKK